MDVLCTITEEHDAAARREKIYNEKVRSSMSIIVIVCLCDNTKDSI